jgi:hypothetical protein
MQLFSEMVNLVRFKAAEDYLLGFETFEEKQQWLHTYKELAHKSAPRKGINIYNFKNCFVLNPID